MSKRQVASATVAAAVAAIMFTAGWVTSTGPSPSTLTEPAFTFVDRALGETADDRPLRACMVDKARAFIVKAGAQTGDSIDYARLEAYLAGSSEEDVQWDSGVLNRATIPWKILAECRAGLMRPNIAVGDLDDDGLPEVLYSTSDGTFRVWWNLGAGRFKPEVLSALSDGGDTEMAGSLRFMPIVLVDADGDGDVDIVVTDLYRNSVKTLLNTGSRTFAPAAEITSSDSIERSAIDTTFTILPADLDEDGRADLIAVTRAIGSTLDRVKEMKSPIRPIRIFYNTGTVGRWQERTLEALPELDALDVGSTDRNPGGYDPGVDTDYQRTGSYTPVIADFNNDGWQDIYVAADFRAPRLFIARPGGRVFDDRTRESQMLDINPETMGAAAIDWDDDGWMDIIATDVDRTLNSCAGGRSCAARGGHRLLRNNGDLTFTDLGRDIGIADAGWGFGFSMTDLNLDGNTDIVVGTGDLSTSRAEDTWGTMFQKPYVLLGDGERFVDQSHSLLRTLPAVTAMNVIVSADFDGDHRPDLLLSGYENRAPYLLLNRTPGNAASVVVKGIAPTGAEGAVVRIEIPGRRPQIFTMPSMTSNYLASTANVAFPIGLPVGASATVTVTFLSGEVHKVVIENGAQYVIKEGER
jgi:hypothetical protein